MQPDTTTEFQMAQAETDPWGNPVESSPEAGGQDEAANPWGSTEPAGPGETETGGSFLDGRVRMDEIDNTLFEPFLVPWFDARGGINDAVRVIVDNFRGFFDITKQPVDWLLEMFNFLLSGTHPFVIIVVFALLCWQLAGVKLAVGSIVSLVFLGAMNVWDEAMITLSLVLTAVFFCILIGLPMGILMARSDRLARTMRPILDAMQTTPAFVYLVPVVMLFGIGRVPGVIVTIIFAVPPLIRLTNLGIRQVPEDLIEASRAFGASSRQILYRIQMPLATPTIMAGVNQTLMLALSMVVIASMIAVPGLGLMVLRGIGRLDVGLATVGGIGIVILAIVLDRMTQALGQDARTRGTRHWYESGPAKWVVGLIKKRKTH